MSIRHILILRLLVAIIVLVGGGAIFSYQDVRHETEELFDAQLARSARLILSLVQTNSEQINFSSIQEFLDANQLQPDDTEEDDYSIEVEAHSSGHVYETKLGFQIWDSAGNLILKSPNIPLIEISENIRGFSDSEFLGYQWRVFSLNSTDGRYRCITAERLDVRNELIGDIFSDLLVLFILLVPVLSITLWFALGQGLSSLRNLTTQINSRDTERLDSISIENAPSEIQTITGALNQLLSKLKLALAREKRVTSDAAHELRTPLAAVKLHAQLASRADNATDRKKAIGQVLKGIDRTTHLVNQLLALARLEPDTFNENMKRRNLNQVVVEEVAMLAPLAHEKNIELSVSNTDDIFAEVDDTAICLLIRNLLNNAINYTQKNGTIDIKLVSEKNQFNLIVEDNGPGIPAAERERVLERFYRLQNHDATGCGIGLSIVMRVVELHGAKLTLDDPDNGTGLRVTVTFPVGASLVGARF